MAVRLNEIVGVLVAIEIGAELDLQVFDARDDLQVHDRRGTACDVELLAAERRRAIALIRILVDVVAVAMSARVSDSGGRYPAGTVPLENSVPCTRLL